MSRITVRVGFLCILSFLLLNSAAHAQTGQLTGTILDSSGAAVPDATVTATGADTGVSRTTQSTNTGAYTIPNLVPANYNVTILKPGFKTVRFDKVTLTIDQTLTIDVKLEISAVAQTVEVSGEVIAPINTEDAQISNVVNSTELKSLPLILRDPYQLVLLSPGTIQSNTRLGGFSVNGQREQNNNFMIDGIDNNDTDVPGIAGGLNALNPDSTQEFRVITNNFNAEYGRDNGAIIDVKSPSGTNSFHGDALWFGRYDALGARDYFNHIPDTPKDPYERNLFGGSFGGPIIHNKTFFFANYEGHRWTTTRTNNSTVPTAAFKTGIFTYTYQDQSGVTHNVPLDVSQAGLGNNALPYGPDPTVAQIFSHYQDANGSAVTSYSGLLFFPSADRETDNSFSIRVDHQLTRNNSLFVRYLFDQGNATAPFHDDILPGGIGATSTYNRTQNAGVGLVTTFSPTIANELRFGGNRTNLPFNCTARTLFDNLGPQFIDPFGRGSDFGFADPVGGGFTSFGCGALGDSNGQARFTGTYQVTDNVTWTRGSHSLKFGGEFRDVYSNGFANFSSRQAFSFDPSGNGIQVFQNLPPADQAQILGDRSLQDAVGSLLGVVTTQTQNQFYNAALSRVSSDERGFRQKEVGLFIQDTWKVKTNFTVTYGLRWDYYSVPYEVDGLVSTLFDDPTRLATTTPFTFTTLKQGGHQIYNDYYKGFDPRIGFAWDPFKRGRTSIRAGYGIFRDRVYGNLFENTDANPPFLQTANGTLPPNNSLQLVAPPMTVGTSAVTPDLTFTGPTLFDHGFKTPSSQNWNVGIQQQFGNNLTVEANYVGVHGIHEFRSVDLNPPQPALVSQLLAFCVPSNPANTGFFNPFNPTNDPTVGAPGQCTQASVTSANLWVGDFFGELPDLGPAGSGPAVLNRAFASAANGFVSGGTLVRSIARSNYNGLQLNVTKRYSHGLQAQLAYTYSHSLDNASDPISPASGNRTFPRNSLNLRPEYGNSDFDVRHRAVINLVYDANIGRGKDHLNKGLVGRALEGWQIAGIVQFQTGLPYDIFGIRDTQHTGFSDRATLVDPKQLHVNPGGNVPSSQVFTGVNIAAFNPDTVTNGGLGGTTPFGVVSNVHRNQFFGPGTDNWDAVVSKNTAITERLKFQLRFEFYNLFNHPQFGQPSNTIASPDLFGFSTSQNGRADGTSGARQLQLAAKLIF